MADRADITPELVRQLLRYEPDTGKLYWLPRKSSDFVSDRIYAAWTAKYEGKEAFVSTTPFGHLKGQINRITFRAHRIAWVIMHGAWPCGDIDHINGDPSDNRISNLRDVPSSENNKNLSRRCDNTSGVTGVALHPKSGRWHVSVKVDGRRKHVGSFRNFDDAVNARKAAEVEFGYHDNHGR